MRDDIAQVRAVGVNFYVIRDGEELFVIDGGFLFGFSMLRGELRRLGWEALPVRGVLLTHGHLDHTLNVSKMARVFGAWVAAPEKDAEHIQGTYDYRGPARVCGLLEMLGRKLLRYRACRPERWLRDGDVLPILEGLHVVGLPGHTVGHVGFYLPSRKLLFCGDLFASYGSFTHLPPRFLNTSENELRESVRKVLAMDLLGLLPNHGCRSTPAQHLARFQRLAKRLGLCPV